MIKSKGAKVSSKLPVRRSVEIPRRKVLRVGRNELCPCGSGKKYKGCHAGEGEAFLQKLAQQEEKERLNEELKRAGVPWYERWFRRTFS
jgi:hypothetical protein